MSNSIDLSQTFFLECEDLLYAMDEGLRDMHAGSADDETVNAVFRAVHSIKGGAGAFGLDELVRFSHRFETVLDALRSGKLTAENDLLEVLQFSGDHLADLVSAARDDGEVDKATTDKHLSSLANFLGGPNEQDSEADIVFEPMVLDIGLPDIPSEPSEFEISFAPGNDLYFAGHEPLNLIRELEELGEVVIALDTCDLPGLDDLDAASSHLSWSIRVKTDADESTVSEIFDFVEGLCEFKIEPLDVKPPVPEIDDEDVLEDEPSADSQLTDTVIEPSAELPKAAIKQSRSKSPTIRVDLERVDKLVNVVGELVIHQAMLTQTFQQAKLPAGSELATGLEDLSQLSREIQESVMAIRAQQIRPLFDRMFRIVREAGAATGKKVVLETAGEMTEVDTAVIEKLADPLTHMIRNAVDHGIEAPDDRIANGKAETGQIMLSAAHRSGRVVITIADDGSGINRPKVRSIAAEKGLIDENAELSDNEIDNLLFMPGFSTASEVSDLSGRGVGMDVVKTAIQALGGRVSISSKEGEGTQLSVSLPLTLAVLDGMVIEVAEHAMVMPISTIVETLKPPSSQFHIVGPTDQLVSVRGVYLPVVDVGAKLGLRPPLLDPNDRVVMIVEGDDGSGAALLVDAIHDQRQVVIKSLEENYGQIDGVAAATVFGDGRVALILDPTSLIEDVADTAAFSAAKLPMTEEKHVSAI